MGIWREKEITKNRVFTYVTEEIKEKLEKIAKKKTIKVSPLIEEIINEHFDENTDELNKYEFLDDGCLLREYLGEEETQEGRKYGEGFYCLKKAPSLIKLGSGVESAAGKICAKCIIREESKQWKEDKKKGLPRKMPICTNGGRPNEDFTEMYCNLIGGSRPIIERKKKTDYKPCRLAGNNNSNCQYLTWKPVFFGQLKEKNNR